MSKTQSAMNTVSFETANIRYFFRNGQPRFSASDICDFLTLVDVDDTIQRLPWNISQISKLDGEYWVGREGFIQITMLLKTPKAYRLRQFVIREMQLSAEPTDVEEEEIHEAAAIVPADLIPSNDTQPDPVNLETFTSEQFGNVRTTTIDGQPWFVAADVCRALEIRNNRDAIARLDDDEKGVASTDTLGGEQKMSIVNEPGLYTLILGSRKPEAKAFKRWITHEVIPSIRKHGMYATDDIVDEVIADPRRFIKILERMADERDKRLKLQARVEQDKPKVAFADSVAENASDITVKAFAAMMTGDETPTGVRRMYNWLRKRGYIQQGQRI